ncbi:DNA repair protein RadC [Orbus hercynius]|uniref:DNA repair protein RadC n=1 Tax=Orbus hercynius TaxID=593135 RepID=A0A495REC5_9GAMM|nr:JAB domain-containing protein [Orbus hercynius]RKS85278.1 DNA repair protein RadC [Orbus hercynius]
MDIKLGKNDKRYIEGTDDVYSIMQRILLRENKIDRDKEHFWIIGMNEAGFILYIELIALGTVRSVPIEPMNIFRVAVMKNATRVIAVHNHPAGSLIPSDADKDITDRLIQVGRILNIDLIDHFIITPEHYLSFRQIELMQQLEQSLKYVPTYQVVEQIRKEEKAIAKEKLAVANDKVKTAEEKARTAKLVAKQEREQKERLVHALSQKDISIEQIATIMEIDAKEVQKILKKKTVKAQE